MFKNILVPLDGSPLAESVLPHVAAIGKAFDSKVTLIRVLSPEQRTDLVKPVDPLNWKITQVEAETYLNMIAMRLEKTGLSVGTLVKEGPPGERIVEFALQDNIDLVVLSSHGSSGLTRWNVSSVTRKIIQNSRRSTMVVRAYAETSSNLEDFHYRRILVPLDGSLRAELVLPTAKTLARFHNAEIILTHIVYKPEMPRRSPLTDEDLELIDHFVERNRQEAVKYLNQIETTLEVEHDIRLIISDNVQTSLQDLAESEKADLVVMSAHGYSGSRRQPFGNVTTNYIEYGSSHLLVIQDFTPEEVEPSKAEQASQEFKGH